MRHFFALSSATGRDQRKRSKQNSFLVAVHVTLRQRNKTGKLHFTQSILIEHVGVRAIMICEIFFCFSISQFLRLSDVNDGIDKKSVTNWTKWKLHIKCETCARQRHKNRKTLFPCSFPFLSFTFLAVGNIWNSFIGQMMNGQWRVETPSEFAMQLSRVGSCDFKWFVCWLCHSTSVT